MKNFNLFSLFFLFSMILSIQHMDAQKEVFKQIKEFRPVPGQVVKSTDLFSRQSNSFRSGKVAQAVKKSTLLRLNQSALNTLYTVKAPKLEMSLPFDNGTLELELIRVELFTPDFRALTSASNNQAVSVQTGVFYRGIVKNDPKSLVTISIFEQDLIAIIASDQGNIVIGNYDKIKKEEYVIYNDNDLNDPLNFDCQTAEVEPGSKLGDEIRKLSAQKSLESRSSKCVRMYFELDYTLVTEKGGAQNAINWMSGIFNQVQALYANEGITMSISEIFAWTSEDPYTGTSTNVALNKFRTTRTSYNGDLAHLVSRGVPTGGGIAYINTLCTPYGYAYSWVQSYYNDFPVYSWSVNVIAHETGHNLGSPHTHNCSWAGGPIDGCGPTANAAYAEGTCTTGPVPVDGGTVMSYCHLLGVGINLNKGFGPLPLNLITNNINGSSCLGQSCIVTVGIPSNIVATDGTAADTVNITWSGTAGNYFQVYRSMSNNSSTATALANWQTASSYFDLAVTPNQTYFYWVREALNNAGASASEYAGPETGWAIGMASPVPTALSASDGTFSDKVTLSWTGTVGNYFQVYRNTTNSNITATVMGSWQTATSYNDLTSVGGQTYYYWVRAASNSAGSDVSAYTSAETGWRAVPVSIPTAVNASDGSFTDKVVVTWNGTAGNFFKVYRNTSNNSDNASTLTAWVAGISYEDNTVAPNTTYYYWVKEASDVNGTNSSNFSSAEPGWSFVPANVNVPVAVIASDGTYTNKVALSWSGTSGNYFQVYRNTTNQSGTSVALGGWQLAAAYEDFTVTPNQTYYYWVREASDNTGANSSDYSSVETGFSNTIFVTVPSAVSASDGTYSDKVTLSWTGTAGNYFQVYRNTTNNNGTATVLGSWQTTTSYNDLTSVAGQTYYYWVRAASDNLGANLSGFSSSDAGWRSVVVNVSVPSGVSASDGAYTDKVAITWNGSAGNYFRVYRHTSNNSGSSTALGSWQTGTSYDDVSATPNQTYYYWVVAASNSSGSNLSSYSSSNSGWSKPVTVTTPNGVAASDGTYSDRVAITWNGSAGNYFRIYRHTSNSSNKATALGSWQTGTSYNDLSATAGKTYYYWVRAASNSSGSDLSSYSSSNSGWRGTAASYVSTTGLQVSNVTSSSARLSWNAVSGASKYSVWYKTGESWVQYSTTTQKTITVYSLKSATPYCFAIKAVYSNSSSDFSESACATTQVTTGQTVETTMAQESSMTIYPNPITSFAEFSIRYSATQSTEATVKVIDGSGKLIGSNHTLLLEGENLIKMNAPHTPGMYLLQLNLKNGKVLVNKLMIH